MKTIWNWLSGKKSVIAGILSLVIGFLQAKGIIDAVDAVFYLSMAGLLLGVGVAHKVAKLRKANAVR